MRQLVVLFLCLFCLSGCYLFRVYQPPQQQGTPITEAELAELNSSFSRADIERKLGSALIEEPLRPQQLLYPYSKREEGQLVKQYVVVIYLDQNDQYQRHEIIGDIAPVQTSQEQQETPLDPDQAAEALVE